MIRVTVMARPLLLACAVIGVAAPAACSREPAVDESGDAAEAVVPVGAQEVRAGSMRAVIHASGVVTPAQGAEFLVIAPEPARIAEITREEGEAVTSGDVLVRLDVASAAEDAARQRAEVARAQVLAENARVAQSRARDLLARGIVSRREMEDADREFAAAQSAVARAETARAAAEAAVARAVIRAPFNGVVARRLREPGDLVEASVTDPVLRLIDPSRLEVTATIPATDASRVLPGATARLALAGPGVQPPLTVAARLPSTSGPEVSVRLTFAEPTTLAVETPVQVDIDAEERTSVVLIPADALLREDGESVVFVAVRNRAERRVVTTGIMDESRVEIISGLMPGELLITRGHVGLDDGAPVSVDISR